ncbi:MULTISPECIES: pyridoxamine 5'-phosphate oxidase family protein [Amycolatopsis]|uniref:Nitroimidazol reductase NimA, pyridoxamine 5'-phosphate oxidase superfamily n=2 Tax=Amycolatopsis TaxID=1813 RepID=A0A1I3L0S2_9PSEU|nr:pyridoxamine 5'-phosphate oxidase family protein [Amycolatopsis sacchari]SFI78188.1 Nitroimidazol reductase NimA, pyridoxamine 5'-phosphate oxidase superfamily [Amycolatopsis sacchari]
MTELRALSPRQCMDLLSSGTVGRLAFSEHAMPAIRPVNFLLHGGDLVIRTSRTGSIAKLVDEVVAFEVDDIDPATHTGWSVVVVGKIHPVTNIEELVTLADPRRRPWPGGERSCFLRLPIDIVSGRTFEAYDVGPAETVAAS